MRELKKFNQDHTFWGLGGDHMIAEGLESIYHVRDLSITGFVEVLKHLFFFRQVMSDIVQACEIRNPDAAILLDYPGFNIRLGIKLKAMGIPVFYYISPQVWAWKKGRVKIMRRFIKRIFVIFPFELEFYQQQGIPVTFAGHPLVEKVFDLPDKSVFYTSHGLDPAKPLVALLPGSRRNEMARHKQPLLETIHALREQDPDLQFAVAALATLGKSYYHEFNNLSNVVLIYDNPYPLIAFARAAIVASGTASLETAFIGTPLVVIYKISFLSYLIGKILVRIDHLAMPNLILGERAVPELIQFQANAKLISRNIRPLLVDSDERQQMLDKLAKLRSLLGQPGCARIVAKQIMKDLN